MFSRETVALRIPMRTGVEGVLVYDDRDRFLGVAHPDTAYHPLDVEGAKESGRRKKLNSGRIKRERADVEKIDPHKVALDTARAAAPAPLEPERGGRIMLTDDMANQAGQLATKPVDVAAIRSWEAQDDLAIAERKMEKEFAERRAARARIEAFKRKHEDSNPRTS